MKINIYSLCTACLGFGYHGESCWKQPCAKCSGTGSKHPYVVAAAKRFALSESKADRDALFAARRAELGFRE
jgi:DnaJ-class molecular chaperone